MDKFKIIDRAHPAGMGGTQRVYKFPNNYGASVVQFNGSYGFEDGLWELGVVQFDDEGDYHLTYDTHITSDVLGYLTDDQVHETLLAIQALPEGDGEV